MSKNKTEIPEHVSLIVRDAWFVQPPCKYKNNAYCHVDCPYYYECYPEHYEDDDEDECSQ